jgi:hypothetical protein
LNVPLSVSDAPANVPVTVGALNAGLVASTTLPLPVVAHATIWLLAFVQLAEDDAGMPAPFTFATVVAPCVPVTSPLRLPLKLAAVVAEVALVAVAALVAFVTAVEPIALTISAAVAADGGAFVCQYPSPLNGLTPPTVALDPLWL